MVNRKIKYFIKDNSNTKTYVQVRNNKFTINPWEFDGNIAIGKTDAVIGNTTTIKDITYVNYLLDYGSFIGRSSLNELSYNSEQDNWRLSIYLPSNSSNDTYLQWFWLPPDEVINNHITGITIVFDEDTKVDDNSFPVIYYKTGDPYNTNNITKNTTNNSITINFFGNDSINLDEIITFPEGNSKSYINSYIGKQITFNDSGSRVTSSSSQALEENAAHYKCQLFFKKGNIKTDNKNILYIKNVTFHTDDSKFITQYPNSIITTINQTLSQNNVGYIYNMNNFYIDEQAYSAGQFAIDLSNNFNPIYQQIGQIFENNNNYRIFPIYFSPGKKHGIINKRTILTQNNKKILNQDWYSEIENNNNTISYYDYARPIFLNERIQ